MGWRGARGGERGVGYERLGAKAGRECLASTGARDKWAASGSRCGARSSRRRAMRGVESDGFGAKGGVACSGPAPIYPTIQARGSTPGRVGKTKGANPGGYQAIAREGVSQGDHRRLRHDRVQAWQRRLSGGGERHLGIGVGRFASPTPAGPVEPALPLLRPPPGPAVELWRRRTPRQYLAPADGWHCLHRPIQPLAGAKLRG